MSTKHFRLIFLFFAFAALHIPAAKAQTKLITSSLQFTSNATVTCDDNDTHTLDDKFDHLLQYDSGNPKNTYFYKKDGETSIYLQIRLNQTLPVTNGSTVDIFRRNASNSDAYWTVRKPMTFEIYISETADPDETDWIDAGTFSAFYNSTTGGWETRKFRFKNDYDIRHFRFVLLKNNGDDIDATAMAGFQITSYDFGMVWYEPMIKSVDQIKVNGYESQPNDNLQGHIDRMLDHSDRTTFETWHHDYCEANNEATRNSQIHSNHFFVVDLGQKIQKGDEFSFMVGRTAWPNDVLGSNHYGMTTPITCVTDFDTYAIDDRLGVKTNAEGFRVADTEGKWWWSRNMTAQVGRPYRCPQDEFLGTTVKIDGQQVDRASGHQYVLFQAASNYWNDHSYSGQLIMRISRFQFYKVHRIPLYRLATFCYYDDKGKCFLLAHQDAIDNDTYWANKAPADPNRNDCLIVRVDRRKKINGFLRYKLLLSHPALFDNDYVGDNSPMPTKLKVDYRTSEDGAWIEAGYIENIPYLEADEQIVVDLPEINANCYDIRFEVVENANAGAGESAPVNDKSALTHKGGTGLRMVVGQFALYAKGYSDENNSKIFSKITPDIFKAMSNPRLYDYELIHTHSFVDNNPDFPEINNWWNWIKNLRDVWNPDGTFNFNTTQIKGQPETFTPESYHTIFPSFVFLTKDGTKVTEGGETRVLNADPRIEKGERQPTHEITKEMWLLPGERVDLYPFSDMHSTSNYYDQYIRWYNYATDELCERLYFLKDPSRINYTKRGHIGGGKVNDMGGTHDYSPSVASYILPVGEAVPDGGEWIAADISSQYEYCQNGRLVHDKNGDHAIIEPTINIRAMFHIVDGRNFAREFSSSVKSNNNYVTTRRRFITARVGVPFTLRLEKPLPGENDFNQRLARPYIEKIEGNDTIYNRVANRTVVVYRYKGIPMVEHDYTKDDPVDDLTFTVYGRSAYKTATMASGLKNMFTDDVTKSNQWINDNITYHRAFACENPNVTGTYLVRLVALDKNRNVIKIVGTDRELIIGDFVVTFEDEKRASFVTEATLYEGGETGRYYKHTNEYLERRFGAPTATRNYDAIYKQFDIPSQSEFYNSPFTNKDGHNNFIYFDKIGDVTYRRSIMPRQWNLSSYAFGWNQTTDYNYYRLIDHSNEATHMHAASRVTNTYTDAYSGKTGLSGVFDRLWYETKGKQRGYMYYINAASDPGTIATLAISNLCVGSTIIVTGWVNEFTDDIGQEDKQPETANLLVHLYAIDDKSGKETAIHSYETGYVSAQADGKTDYGYTGAGEQRGKWMQFYFSFVPDLGIIKRHLGNNVDLSEVRYQIRIENGCISSKGADYAFDDFRIYVVKPRVYATQTIPLCNPEEEKTSVRIETPFDVILRTLGGEEATSPDKGVRFSMYYTFLDKEKFDSGMKRYENDPDRNDKVFRDAVLKFDYDGDGNKDSTHGTLSFNSFYNAQEEYDYAYDRQNFDIHKGKVYRLDEDGERTLVFLTRPEGKDIHAGKEYIIALYVDQSTADGTYEPTATDFDVSDHCSKTCIFRVNASHIVKIDGFAVPDDDNIICCENQKPVVQIDLVGKRRDIETESVFDRLNECHYFDWYLGGSEDFYCEKLDEDNSLIHILGVFRDVYPLATDLSDEPNPVMDYTQEYRDYLIKLVEGYTVNDVWHAPKLRLHLPSYTFEDTKLDEGEEYRILHVMAVPIVELPDATDQYLICTEPCDVKLTVTNHAPIMLDGFPNIPYAYPAGMDDVPLRLGLGHINAVKYPQSEIGDAAGSLPCLYLPLRKVEPVTSGVSLLKAIADDSFVYLSGTDDPEYRNLEDLDESTSRPGAEGVKGLRIVGELVSLTAEKPDESNAKGQRNIAGMVFYSDKIDFKEGYYYTLRFAYEESYDGTNIENQTGFVRPCSGECVVTFKVVPEYQMWTGGTVTEYNDIRHNWNNEANWRRVSSAELLRAQNSNDDFTTDGNNSNTFAYQPLYFTKVIIPAGAQYPHMFKPVTAAAEDYIGNGLSKNFDFEATPENAEANTGVATAYINFDMVAHPGSEANNASDHNVYCYPWQSNWCDEIHFLPNAEILAQNRLNYNKAWVDMEMAPSRWYLLTSPLRDTYAGDMYLPADNARQQTELFKDINFAKGINDRFAPAVFQRGWDKSVATVYELPAASGGVGSDRNVAIRTDWSHVYNDVTEAYSNGAGFSIKTDVSKLPGLDDNAGVLFRLPKADATYDYYNADGTIHGNNTPITRTGSHRLHSGSFTATIASAGNSRYFLVGNPYMAHLNMESFLNGNPDIQKKFWMMTEAGQTSGVMVGDELVTTGPDFGTVAPMQGFFVEANNATSSLNVNFNADWTSVEPYSSHKGNLLRSHSRSDSDVRTVRITACSADSVPPCAVIAFDGTATTDYDDNEDVALLVDPERGQNTILYTVAGHTATSINVLPDITATEIGLIATDDDTNVLRFEGLDTDADGVVLFDALTGETTDIHEGTTYEVKGNVAGRLFLTALGNDNDSLGLDIKVEGKKVSIKAPANASSLNVRVCDLAGQIIRNDETGDGQISFYLDNGFYIIEAATDTEARLVRKALIK